MTAVVLTSAAPANAGYATGGGNYTNSIYWLDWRAGTNFATQAEIVAAGGTTTATSVLKVGTTVTHTVAPDYVVTATVVRIGGSTTPNSLGTTASGGTNNMVVWTRAQDAQYSRMRILGYNTGSQQSVISPITNGGNISVTIGLSATYKGVAVPVNAIFADGEDENSNEVNKATTDGAPWINAFNAGTSATPMWLSQPTALNAVGGFGTQTVGPVTNTGRRTPVAMSRDAKNIQIQIASAGMQNAMFGVFIGTDAGDAPASYGSARALASYTFNAEANPAYNPLQPDETAADAPRVDNGSQIYFGTTKPDRDSSTPVGNWTSDDSTNTNDESVAELVGSATFPALNRCTLNYPLTLNATAPNGTPVAGWMDFNGNGVFDSGERAAGTVSAGKVTLNFPGAAVPTATGVGLRLWISSDAASLAIPTGSSPDGEVQDHLVPVSAACVNQTSTGGRGETQTATATSMFPGIDLTGAAYDFGLDGSGNPILSQPALDSNGNTVGTYTIDPATGAITFVPVAGYDGTPVPATVRATTASGQVMQATYSPTVTGIDPVAASGDQGQPVTVAPALHGIDPSTVRLLDPSGNPVSTLTVPGEGTWTVDPTTGAMTFAPEAGFQGSPTPQQYVGSDSAGRQTPPATVTVTYPDVSPVSKSGAAGTPVTQAPVVADGTDPSTVKLLDGSGNPVSTLVVPGEGTWTVDPATGAMTFTPEAGFDGIPTPQQYVAYDAAGNVSLPAAVVVTYPVVPDLVESGAQGQPVTVTPALADNMDPTTVKLLDPSGNPVSSLVVPGEGTWTVDPATGAITFTPEAGFQGNPTPITYVASDQDGNVSTPGTVTVTYPDVPDLVKAGDQGQPVTQTPALADNMDPTTVKLLDPSGNPVSTLVVPGEGTWTVDPATGAITFTPEAGFQGNPTPITYVASDQDGNVSEPGSVTVTYPDVSNVTGAGDQGQPVTVAPVVAEGTDPSTVKLLDPSGNPVSTLTVPGEGTWTVDPTTGAMTFIPEAGFQGSPTPQQYVAYDAAGNVSLPANVTVTYPDVSNVTGAGVQGQPVTVAPVVAEGTDPSTVKLLDGSGNPVSTLTVPGEGTWTVDPTTGAMTFTPEAGFQGSPTPQQYVAYDAAGNVSLPANVTVTYPDVANATGAGDQGQPVTVAPIVAEGTDPSTVKLLDGSGNPVSTLTVPGEGTWTVDPTTGAMTFAPEAGFQGSPTPQQYVAYDAAGNVSLPANVTVTYPDVSNVTASGTPGQPVTVAPIVAEGTDPSTVKLLDGSGNPVSTLVVPGEGTWTVDPATGAITFTPEAGFQGNPTPITYVASDQDGNVSTPGTVTVTYPDVSNVTASGTPGQPVTVAPVVAEGTDPSTVKLLDGSGNPVSTLVVPGEGTWTVDPATGAMTFTPEAGFDGIPTPQQYVAYDAAGNVSLPAAVVVTYPVVPDLVGSGDQGQPVTVTPALGDNMDPTTVKLLDGSGNPVSTLVVPGEGTWTVDPATGAITFTPEAGFQGNPTPITYVASDQDSNVSTPGSVTVTYPDVSDVVGAGKVGSPVTVKPALGDNMDPTTVKLLDPSGNPVSTLVVPGEGTWTVDPTTGAMTFTPEAGFTGQPTPQQYVASDVDGNVSQPASVSITYTANPPVAPVLKDLSAVGVPGQPVTLQPQLPSGVDPTTVHLLTPDGTPVTTLVVPGEGTWTVDPATGAITFTPEPGFIGSPTPVWYTAQGPDGTWLDPATVTVTYPVINTQGGGVDIGNGDGSLAYTGAAGPATVLLALLFIGIGGLMVAARRRWDARVS